VLKETQAALDEGIADLFDVAGKETTAGDAATKIQLLVLAPFVQI